MKKTLVLLLALVFVFASVAMAEQEGYPEVVEGIDFGGATISIYDYWTGSAEREADPDDETAALYAFRDWMEETYNCKLVQIAKGDWASNVEELVNFVNAGQASELCLYILPPDFVGSPMANDYFAAWDETYIDLSDEKWNAGDVDFMTINGTVYGVYAGAAEPRQCLYFNKSVLENAGIDWNTIYDMQADGTWTWDAFENLLAQIQKDTDNDGITDIYGMTGNNSDFYIMGVFSNNGSFFDFDENGDLTATVGEANALEGLNWTKRIWETYAMPQPDGSNWDYFKDAFKAGNTGFYMYQTYGGFNNNAELSDTTFEWGCVAFPKGPAEGSEYCTVISDNMTVIPNVYDADTVAKLCFIYDLWVTPTPGYDDEYAWIGNKYNFTDERAVDETYAMLREAGVTNKCLYLGSVNDVLGSPLLWNMWREPAEVIEEAMPQWQALCDTFNGK